MHQPAITPPKLKIVVLLDSSTVPAWVHRALTDVETSEFAETVLWILGTRRRGNRAVFRDLWRSLSAGLFTLYRWLDRAMYKHAHDAFAPVSVLENPQGKEILRAVLTGDGASDRFEPEDLHKIRTCDPDVILQFGFDDLKGDILQAARFGVWAVSPGHSPNHVVSPAMFWDIYFKRTLSETGLYVMAESREDRRVLYQSIAHVNLNSLYRSSNPIYWKGSQFLGRRLRDLWQHGWQTVPGCKRPDGTAVFRMDRAPGNARMVRFMGSLALRFLRNKYMAWCYYDQWHVALHKRRSFSGEGLDGAGFELLKSPPHSFFADPILITRGANTFLFVEEFDWKTRKGVISCCELAA